MPGKWQTYWSVQARPQVLRALDQWRQSGRARVPLLGLQTIIARSDLYSSVTVTMNGPSANVGGKQHMLDLARELARLLQSGETVRASIITDGKNDYLELRLDSGNR